MGLSAAVELRRRGASVTLLDQHALPHALGSSHGETRVIRTAYFEHPNYVPLARRAWDAWVRIGEAEGEELLRPTGGLYLGRPESALISGSIEAALRGRLPYQVTTPHDVRSHYTQVFLPDDFVAFFEEQCGVLFAARCLAKLKAIAMREGVEVLAPARVSSWNAANGRVTVLTDDGRHEGDALVLCPGPWSSGLIAGLGIPLRVSRQVVGFTSPANPEPFTAGRLPVMCMESTSGEFYYTIPICPGVGERTQFFKCGNHRLGETIDPDSPGRAPNPEDNSSFQPGLREFLPDAAEPVVAMDVCLYTNTPDGHFVLDRHPERPNVVIGCGFSGHGFKFGPVIGEALAELALEGSTKLPVDFLSARRLTAPKT